MSFLPRNNLNRSESIPRNFYGVQNSVHNPPEADFRNRRQDVNFIFLLKLGNAGIIRDQRYRTDHDAGMPIPD
jgi:hypothetical protein